ICNAILPQSYLFWAKHCSDASSYSTLEAETEHSGKPTQSVVLCMFVKIIQKSVKFVVTSAQICKSFLQQVYWHKRQSRKAPGHCPCLLVVSITIYKTFCLNSSPYTLRKVKKQPVTSISNTSFTASHKASSKSAIIDSGVNPSNKL